MGSDTKQTPGTLGTFAGVFTPSILTILGIILFLRTGYVVGSAGLLLALVMVLLSNAISVLTSLSLSAIATNLRVKGGGDYYVISRTLGVEYGGAIGTVLYLAQSVSIAFYAIGFGEAVSALTGGPWWLPQVIAASAVLGLFVLAWLGSDWASRFQFVVMAVLFSALTVFFIGGVGAWDVATARDNLQPSLQLDGTYLGFWAIFAIFFPAVTGFTQGVSMSGDLRDPARSLPRGTFLAVGLSMVVYLAVAIVFAGAATGTSLVANLGVMREISLVPGLIDAGVIAATLSSALASFLGAPRILQAMSRDRIFPFLRPFAQGVGPTSNPRRGVLLSLGIALATVALGDLNAIAPIVSMFFLISYGLLNYATYYEARANSPSFRPRFRYFNKRLSLLGAVACGGVMLAIEPVAAVVAALLLWGIHQYLRRSAVVERWADSERSLRFQTVRDNLLSISAEVDHPRDWRPVLLAFSDDPERRERLLRFAGWLEGGAGFTTAVRIVRAESPGTRRVRDEAEDELRASLAKANLPVFARVVVTDQPDTVLPTVVQSFGLGRVRPNTVLFNWMDRETLTPTSLETSARELRHALRFGCHLLLLSHSEEAFARIEETPARDRRIDVWYRDNSTGKLMLLLAYLMTRSKTWHDATVRLLVPRRPDSEDEAQVTEMKEMLDGVRIEATVELVDRCDAQSLMRRSLDATVTLLPFRLTDSGPEGTWGGALAPVLEALGVTLAALAAADIELDSAPEEGKRAEIASAVDAAEEARRAAVRLEKELADATVVAGEAQHRFNEAERLGEPDDEARRLRDELNAADQAMERAKRRLAKGRAKADAADEQAHALTRVGGDDAEATGDDDPTDGST